MARHLRSIAVASALFAAGTVGFTDTAHAGSCTHRTGVSHYDNGFGKTWYHDWVCGNRGGVNVYISPDNRSTVTGKLDSTTSWFVCYVRGQYHSGGNNVWYRTQGDRVVNYPWLKGWGYVAAVHVWTSTDPWPGMPYCSDN